VVGSIDSVREVKDANGINTYVTLRAHHSIIKTASSNFVGLAGRSYKKKSIDKYRAFHVKTGILENNRKI